jgi:hypothetical protein
MFLDIRNFTAFAEQRPPADAVRVARLAEPPPVELRLATERHP